MKISKFQVYSFFSLVVPTILGYIVFLEQKQFFPTFLRLTTWSISKMALINLFICLFFILHKITGIIFFSQLREFELDKLYERFFINIFTTAISLTIFRIDITKEIILIFIVLTFFKNFHTLADLRTKHIESISVENSSRLTHIRLFVLLFILLFGDVIIIRYFFQKIFINGLSMHATAELFGLKEVFGFEGNKVVVSFYLLFLTEFVILCISVISIIIRFGAFLYNLWNDFVWRSKGEFVFYLGITSDIFQSLAYVIFFLALLAQYGLPIHILRECFIVFRRISKRVRDLIVYRKISHNFDERFPTATTEELRNADTICTICLQEMRNPTAKKLICNHFFHANCLKDWLARSQQCPICRHPVRSKKRRETVRVRVRDRRIQNQILNMIGRMGRFRANENVEGNNDNVEGEDNVNNGRNESSGKEKINLNEMKSSMGSFRSMFKGEEKNIAAGNNEMAKLMMKYFQHSQMMNYFYYQKFLRMMKKEKKEKEEKK